MRQGSHHQPPTTSCMRSRHCGQLGSAAKSRSSIGQDCRIFRGLAWDTPQVSNVDRMARDYFPASTPLPPVSGLAVASLILGLLTTLPALLALLIRSGGFLAFLLYLLSVGVPALIAVVLGHVALSTIKRAERRGRGMAGWGVALGYLALAAPVVAAVLAGGR